MSAVSLPGRKGPMAMCWKAGTSPRPYAPTMPQAGLTPGSSQFGGGVGVHSDGGHEPASSHGGSGHGSDGPQPRDLPRASRQNLIVLSKDESGDLIGGCSTTPDRRQRLIVLRQSENAANSGVRRANKDLTVLKRDQRQNAANERMSRCDQRLVRLE